MTRSDRFAGKGSWCLPPLGAERSTCRTLAPAAILLSLGGGAKNYDMLYALPDGRGAWARSTFSL
jgi:hypothetical protein